MASTVTKPGRLSCDGTSSDESHPVFSLDQDADAKASDGDPESEGEDGFDELEPTRWDRIPRMPVDGLASATTGKQSEVRENPACSFGGSEIRLLSPPLTPCAEIHVEKFAIRLQSQLEDLVLEVLNLWERLPTWPDKSVPSPLTSPAS